MPKSPTIHIHHLRLWLTHFLYQFLTNGWFESA
ncbi:hypothetical protein GLYMA_03G063150v4 [Glycine max]|nr:hypothetical protein GLYMA_03G063150v4 [Glycine max]KAH1068800.1 hypothetical protein GYH30_006389 [Glycine max]